MFRRIREKLEKEVHQLEQELRTELPREIQLAVAMGDLRENAEYQTALERQGFVQARLRHLRKLLTEIASVDLRSLPRDRIGLGSTINLVDVESGKKVSYELVLSEEVDFPKGRISAGSPIGKALLGKKVGDEVVVRAPSGVRTLEVKRLLTVHDRPDEK